MYYIVFQVLLIALFCVWCHPCISRIYTYYFIIFHPNENRQETESGLGLGIIYIQRWRFHYFFPSIIIFFDRRKTEKKKWKGMLIKANGVEGRLSRFSDATRRAWPLQTTETELSLYFIFISFDDKLIISPWIKMFFCPRIFTN